MRTFLVTGGTGFIGSALVRRLLSVGNRVNVLDNMSRGRSNRLSPYAGYGMLNVINGDIRKPFDVWRAMQDVDVVVHLAYKQGTKNFYSDPKGMIDVAYKGILNVLEAMEGLGVRDLVMMSSSEAYQTGRRVPTDERTPLVVPDILNPRYSYGGGKIACELASQAWFEAGLLDRLVIPRPHNIYGPDMGNDHVIPEFCTKMNELVKAHASSVVPLPIQGTGWETRSFCYIDDFTDQMMLLLRPSTPSGVYHLGTQDERSIRDVADHVAKAYGRTVNIIPGELAKGSPPRRCPDTAKIQSLGWDHSKRVPFEEGVKRTVLWYQEAANG